MPRVRKRLIWDEWERQAWAVERQRLPSEWAEQERRLSGEFSAEPGAYRNARTPYLVEIMDAAADPAVERVTFRKSSQIGGTEALLNIVGWAIDESPGPMLYVMPTERDATGLAGERIKELIASTPALVRHVTDKANDLRGDLWRLDTMLMRLAWPTPSRLASMPCMYVILDEIDKFEKVAGKEANPMRLAEKRTDTFRSRRKIITISTPVGEEDHCTVEYLKGSQEEFWLPCPHCGQYQPLRWSQVRWPQEERDPQAIKMQRLAWYECCACEKRILDHHKASMLSRGVWCPADCWVENDGTLGGERPQTAHRSFHLWAGYSPWVPFSDLASEWVAAQGKPEDLQDFVNSRLGEPWVEVQTKTDDADIERVKVAGERGVVPAGAAWVVTSIDVQKDCVWWASRAFGEGGTSWSVDYGQTQRLLMNLGNSPDHDPWGLVVRDVIQREYIQNGVRVPARLVLIDSGAFTGEVYALCRRFPGYLLPVKGANNPMPTPFRASRQDKDSRGNALREGLVLWTLDVDHYKTELFRRMGREAGMAGRWHALEDCDATYRAHLTAEQRKITRNRKTGVERYAWVKKPGADANHLLDCEVYNLAAGDMLHASSIRHEHIVQTLQALQRPPQTPDDGRQRRAWIEPRKERWM